MRVISLRDNDKGKIIHRISDRLSFVDFTADFISVRIRQKSFQGARKICSPVAVL